MKAKAANNRARILSLALVASIAGTAFHSIAATHYVSQTSPSPTPPYLSTETAAHNIQDAVDMATDGDTVLVEPGDYGVTIQITVTNAVRLQSSAGASQTFLTGYGSWCLAISNALAAADGFTLRRQTGYSGGAVLVGGTIQNCNFTNFYTDGSIVMSGGTVSNVIVTYFQRPGGAAVHCSDSGLITDSQILGVAGPSGHGATGVALVNSRLQNSVISGLAIFNNHGVAVSAISSTVVGCTIKNNYSFGQGGGAYLDDSLMDRCIVTGNTAGGAGPGLGGGGIFETNSVIRNSLIVSNHVVIGDGGVYSGAFGGGVYMRGGALLNCTVSGNSAYETSTLPPGAGGGVFAESGGITNCIIYFNSLDLNHPSTNWYNAGPAIFDHCCTAPAPGGAGNITQDPQFANAASGNDRLAPGSPCIDTGINQPWMTGAKDLDGYPRIRGTTVDMGAYENPSPAGTHYVSQTSPNPTPPYSSTETAAHTIQDAVDVSVDGDTVLVAPGDYGVTNQITVTRAVRLQSTGGASQTFLTAYGSVCLSISNALAAADGFSLRPGAGDPRGANLFGGTIQNCNFTNFYATFGSIVMSGGTVSNVIVWYYRGHNGGAAVSCSDSGLITDSQILGKAPLGFGASAVALVNSRLQNSVITGTGAAPNTTGVAVSAVSSTVVRCTISNNYNKGQGGGAYLQDSLMDRCIVTGNTSGGNGPGDGGGGIFETNSVIRNSLIANNGVVLGDGGSIYGGYGGGVHMQGGALLNCTVSRNTAVNFADAPGAGAGIYVEGSGAVTNSIIYFNSFSGDSASSSNWFNAGSGIFDHSCTAPDPGGTGNVVGDPQFVNAPSGNFHLASISPCIDAGISQPWMAGAQDLDGNPRVAGASVDMGAYESAAPPILSIQRSGPNIILRWPSAGTTDLMLQQSGNVASPESWTYSGATITDDGTHKSATIPATNSIQFFRLR